MQFYVFGAGGHGKVVAEALVLAHGEDAVLGFLDDLRTGQILNWPIQRLDNIDVKLLLQTQLIVAVGQNRSREEIANRLTSIGANFGRALHPRASISPSAEIAPGVTIMAGAIINAQAYLGEHAIVNSGAIVEHDCVICDYAHLAPGCKLGGGVTVGRRSLVGLGAAVLPGIVIGDDCMIGAGAVVTKNVAPETTVVGIPAHPIHPPI